MPVKFPNEDIQEAATPSQSEGRFRLEKGCRYYTHGEDDERGGARR